MNSFQEGFIKAATAHGIAEQPLVECMNASKETFEVITELFKQADFSRFKNQLYDTLIKNTGLEKHLDPLREAIMSRLNVDPRTASAIMAAGGGGLTGLVGSQLFDLPVLESTLLGAGAAGAGAYSLADDPTKYISLATRAARKLRAPAAANEAARVAANEAARNNPYKPDVASELRRNAAKEELSGQRLGKADEVIPKDVADAEAAASRVENISNTLFGGGAAAGGAAAALKRKRFLEEAAEMQRSQSQKETAIKTILASRRAAAEMQRLQLEREATLKDISAARAARAASRAAIEPSTFGTPPSTPSVGTPPSTPRFRPSPSTQRFTPNQPALRFTPNQPALRFIPRVRIR